MSGRSRMTWRSKRPGRRSAGSRTSGRLVAATTITLVFVSKPSISTRIWLRVCSRSSCEPPRPAPRWRPTASISSTNTMHGLLRFAWSNRSRTRLAPTPTNISTNSEPEMLKNGTPASPATARAMRVLPVPGGPDEQHAARDARAERVELLGVLEELHDLLELRLRLVDPGDVGERDDRLVAEEHPGAALAEAEGLVIGPLGLAHHEEDEAADHDAAAAAPSAAGRSTTCRPSASSCRRPAPCSWLPARAAFCMSRVDVAGDRVGDDDRVRRPGLGRDRQRLAVLAHRRDLARLDIVVERRVRRRSAGAPTT